MSATAFQRKRREGEKRLEFEKTFRKRKVEELRDIVKEKGIEGYEDMKKDELLNALKDGE